MTPLQTARAALEADTLPGSVRPSDNGFPHLVLKTDRRRNRMPTPACPRCQGTDDVSVVARGCQVLMWRCECCAWAWNVPKA
jgi:hypothetical protein